MLPAGDGLFEGVTTFVVVFIRTNENNLERQIVVTGCRDKCQKWEGPCVLQVTVVFAVTELPTCAPVGRKTRRKPGLPVVVTNIDTSLSAFSWSAALSPRSV